MSQTLTDEVSYEAARLFIDWRASSTCSGDGESGTCLGALRCEDTVALCGWGTDASVLRQQSACNVCHRISLASSFFYCDKCEPENGERGSLQWCVSCHDRGAVPKSHTAEHTVSVNAPSPYRQNYASWNRPRIESGEIPSARFAHSAVAHGSCVYFFGGASGQAVMYEGGSEESRIDTLFNDMHIFDTEACCWTSVDDSSDVVPSPRCGHCAITIPKVGMLLFGGGKTERGRDATNDLWLFHFGANTLFGISV